MEQLPVEEQTLRSFPKKFIIIFIIILILIPSTAWGVKNYAKLNQFFQELIHPYPKPGSCKILEEKYCSKGRLIIDGVGSSVGFNLPKNTPLFALKTGQAIKTKYDQTSKFKGFGLMVIDPNDPTVTFHLIGDIDIGEFRTQNVEQGDKIGQMQDTGVKNYGYNLIVTGLRESTLDTALLSKLFTYLKL